RIRCLGRGIFRGGRRLADVGCHMIIPGFIFCSIGLVCGGSMSSGWWSLIRFFGRIMVCGGGLWTGGFAGYAAERERRLNYLNQRYGVDIPFCGVGLRDGLDLFAEVHEREKAKGPALAGLFY